MDSDEDLLHSLGGVMTIGELPMGFSFAPAGRAVDSPAVAREFEALLIARLLKTAREAGETLGGSAQESKQTGAEGYLEIAEEHVACVMAERGCFGIAQILLKSMEPRGDGSGEPPEAPSGPVESAGH